MTIPEMHVWFRQYAQQMGMQNVRAILPEQIDLLINTSITDTVNQIIRENIGVTNDRIITDNSKIGQINALRPLYKVEEIPFVYPSITIPLHKDGQQLSDRVDTYIFYSENITSISEFMEAISHDGFTDPIEGVTVLARTDSTVTALSTYNSAVLDSITELLEEPIPDATISSTVTKVPTNTLDGSITLDIKSSKKFCLFFAPIKAGSTVANIDASTVSMATINVDKFSVDSDGIYPGLIKANNLLQDFLYIVDFSVNYKKVSKGVKLDNIYYLEYVNGDNSFTSNYFPVRIIDDAYLSDTLNDFVLKPRLRTPVVTIYNDSEYAFYFDKFVKRVISGTTDYMFSNNLLPYKFRCSYIKKPAKVLYREDLSGQNIDCDLPEYLHVDILKHAVDLYNTSIQGNLYAAQQQQQAQNREVARNQARSDNEGYQS